MKKIFLVLLSICLFYCSLSPVQAGAEVKIRKGRPSLFIDGTLVPPFAYMSYLPETDYYREAASAGIHLYCFPAYLGDRGINSTSGIGPFRPPIWKSENQFDFSSIENDFQKIMEADPRASVIIRLHLDVPQWWDKAHPEECSLQPDGSLLRQSFSSDLWRKQAGSVLEKCVKWLLASPYEPNLAGIHIAAGYTEEWFYHFTGSFHDRSAPRVKAFQDWLRKKYNNSPDALRHSWMNAEVDFTNALPADISGETTRDLWRSPDREAAVLDTFRFHAETMADNIAYFCRIVKDAGNHRLLTGAFYGYHFYVTDPRRGHGALSRLLECSDLDYLSSPNVYNRITGEDWSPMVAVQSVQAHGKLWLAENDTRTSLTTPLKEKAPDICPPGKYEGGVWTGPPDIRTSAELMRKDLARMLCHGYGGWWFDMWGGWFSHKELLGVIESGVELASKYPLNGTNPSPAQVFVLADEELQFYDASFGKLTSAILSNRKALGKTGAPYELYLRCDRELIPTEQIRVIWLLGFPELTADETSRINSWLEAGITVLWTNLKGTEIFRRSSTPTIHENRFSWTAAELRNIWRDAGVHIYIDTDDILYAGNGWLGLHSARKGKKLINLPFTAKIINPAEGSILAKSAQSISLHLDSGETSLLRIEPPEQDDGKTVLGGQSQTKLLPRSLTLYLPD